MISTLKKLLSRQDGREHLLTPRGEEADFILQYDALDVGRLWLRGGVWHFKYTSAFQSQKDVQPLVDFPHPEKHYKSDALWPFFAVRIPSTEQPGVQRILAEENLDAVNEAQLLKRFGKTTISNPFNLEPAF